MRGGEGTKPLQEEEAAAAPEGLWSEGMWKRGGDSLWKLLRRDGLPHLLPQPEARHPLAVAKT